MGMGLEKGLGRNQNKLIDVINSTPVQFIQNGNMSASQLRLASYILKEHYGDIVEEVGLYVLRKGWTTLACIKQDIKLNIGKVS